MNKIYLFLVAAALLGSCSNDDPEPKKDFGALQQIDSYADGTKWQTTQLEYAQDKQLHALTVNTMTAAENRYVLTYENGIATGLQLAIDYYQPSNTDQNIAYDITYDANGITVTPTTTNGNKVIIRTTDGFIDYYVIFYGENDELYTEETFTRNPDNTIKSVYVYDTNQSDATIFVWEHTFSDFDMSVNLNPVYNPIFELLDLDLIRILNLKISTGNPTLSYRRTGNDPQKSTYRTLAFEATTNGFVEKCTLNTDASFFNYVFTYEE
ncbi:MAG: hypothetical protein WBM98_07420 [Maribacter sp.]|uniref:hypothetical protein n=1 Tax=Maribacter sp. TaxID=1897614 RepID=UPI003C74A6A3